MDYKTQRQVSYFGPIYIRSTCIEVPDPSPRKEHVRRKNLEADAPINIEQIDVSKYRIQTSLPDKKHLPPFPGSNIGLDTTISRDEGPENGTNGERLLKPNVGSVSQRNNTRNEEEILIERMCTQGIQSQSGVKNAIESHGDYQVKGGNMSEDDTLDTQNGHFTVQYGCPFKISSTEDNYMFEKYKSKAVKSQGTSTEDDETLVHSSDRRIFHQRSKSAEETRTSTKEKKEPQSNSRFDFLLKHRKRVAKLKRRFLESHTVPKPLSPVEGNNKITSGEQKLDTCEYEIPSSAQPMAENIGESDHNEKQQSADDNFVQERRRRYSADEILGRDDFEALRTRWSSYDEEFAVVIAIDFGTTYSGYAYSFLHEPDTINLMRRQESGEPGIFDQKIPTTILLTPEGVFHSFGYGARDFYNDLEPKEACRWLYFDQFKMLLHKEGVLRQDSVLRTLSGREISAMKIFSYSLAYFKDLALQEIRDQSALSINTDVIRWVITVPAIWKASAKQFMRQAACEAGIVSNDRPDQLLIALEPEAASIYCRRLRLFQVLTADDNGNMKNGGKTDTADEKRTSSWSLPELRGTELSLKSNDLQPGTRYMVVDCGGGTVDITVHELLADKRLKELQRATGGAHGSVGVDKEFVKLLGSIFGHDILDQFRRRRPSGWVELMSVFESRKRTASPYRASSISVPLPFSFIDFFKKCRGSSIENAVRKYGDNEITWSSSGMLRLSPTIMRRLFRPTVDSIKQAIGDVLNNPRLPDIKYMFLAGGFAESSIIQHELRKDFGALMNIIIPPGVAMTVLKGAVCFGLDPDIVKSRCSCLTYGVGVLHRFNPSRHPVSKKVTKDNIDWCTDIFDVFVTVNQSVDLGESIVRRYTPVRRDQTATTINIYSTDQHHVTFVSDVGVTKCGTLTLALSDAVPVGQRREIRAEMLFGDTEIRVRAVDVSSNHAVEASIDFINI